MQFVSEKDLDGTSLKLIQKKKLLSLVSDGGSAAPSSLLKASESASSPGPKRAPPITSAVSSDVPSPSTSGSRKMSTPKASRLRKSSVAGSESSGDSEASPQTGSKKVIFYVVF